MNDVTFEESLLRFEQQHVFMMNVVQESFKWPDGQKRRAIGWQYGGHFIDKGELHLSDEERQVAARRVMNSITYLLAAQICEAMKRLKPPARQHPQAEVASAFEMSRLIRNAFAHDPGVPTWSIDPDCANKVFEVSGIMRLDTTNLQGQPIAWEDYGGFLAVHRLSQWVRQNVLQRPANSSAST